MTGNMAISHRTLRLAAAVAAATTLAFLLTSGPAQAVNDSTPILELSPDGIHYGPDQLANIFAPGPGLVPGESRSATVWVRNSSKQARRLSLAMTATGRDSTLAGHLRLTAAASGWDTASAIPPAAGQCATLMEGWEVAGGGSLPITFSLGLDIGAPNSVRRQEGDFEMIFLLQDIDAARPLAPCATADGGGTSTAAVGRAAFDGSTGSSAIMPGAGSGQEPDTMVQRAVVAQSNVVITSHSPWPWLVAMGAGAWARISLRNHRRTP